MFMVTRTAFALGRPKSSPIKNIATVAARCTVKSSINSAPQSNRKPVVSRPLAIVLSLYFGSFVASRSELFTDVLKPFESTTSEGKVNYEVIVPYVAHLLFTVVAVFFSIFPRVWTKRKRAERADSH